jgi:Putative amidoligase enzyme
MHMNQHYRLPPLITDTSGQTRRAGFEFEFGNLPIVDTAHALREALGGELEIKSPFETVLHDSTLGKLKIERDADILKSVRYRSWLESLGVEFKPGSLAHDIETNIDNASRVLIPCEVVTQPIPFDHLDKLDTLITTLNGLGAEGTQDSLIYAFGLHINPSIPARSAGSLRRYIQAFLLLYTWIIDSSRIDITRRFLTKYIDPFPQSYMELAMDNAYQPDLAKLTDDYLEHNPTRNRALDMLPILCELDEARVLNAINDDERNLIKGRPAFHYRLPDCKINEPGWSAATAWNRWVFVEQLAADDALLAELIEEWRASNDNFSLTPKTSWSLRLTTILSQKFFER